MADKRDEILACIARHYPLRPLSMSRIYEGCGTRNWCLHAAEGRFFVKEYPGQINVDEERQALDLARYARDCGIPTPRVIATRSENLICTSGDTTFVLFEWADGCTAKPSLALEQMAHSSPWGDASSLQRASRGSRRNIALVRIRRGRQAERSRALLGHPRKARAGRQKDTSRADRTQTARAGSPQAQALPIHNSSDTQRLWPPQRDVQRRQGVCRSRFSGQDS